MATEASITEYHKGEYVRILFYAKNRAGEVLPNPSQHTVTMTVGESPEGSALLTLSTTNGKITLNNEATAEFIINIYEADQTNLVEGRSYYYNIWTWSDATPTVQSLQAKGDLILKSSIEP